MPGLPLGNDPLQASGCMQKPGLLERFAPVVWLNLAMAVAVLYGILNDQITVTISPEYFSVFKRWQFLDLLQTYGMEAAPTRLQAVLVGAAATWWFGLLLGMMVSVMGTAGRARRLTTPEFIRAVAWVMAVTALFSLVFGIVGYVQGPQWLASPQWQSRYGAFLHGIEDTHSAVTVGCWHDGAYLGGLVGAILACALAWRWRRRASPDTIIGRG